MNKQVNGKLIEMTPEEVAELEASRVVPNERKISHLWESANSYVNARLTPAGLSALLQYKDTHVKAGAIVTWYDGVWTDYYSRRDAVEAGTFDNNYDFSNNGELPHTFREARAEIEGS